MTSNCAKLDGWYTALKHFWHDLYQGSPILSLWKAMAGGRVVFPLLCALLALHSGCHGLVSGPAGRFDKATGGLRGGGNVQGGKVPSKAGGGSRGAAAGGGGGDAVKGRRLSFGEEMVAGACARAAAQLIMFPADVLKTLRQVIRCFPPPSLSFSILISFSACSMSPPAFLFHVSSSFLSFLSFLSVTPTSFSFAFSSSSSSSSSSSFSTLVLYGQDVDEGVGA